MANSISFQADWALEVQERLSDPALWNIVNDFQMRDSQVFNNPYETHSAYVAHTRGTAYTHQDVVFTNENATINASAILPQKIDRADLLQSRYADLMKLAKQQGITANEALDTAMLASHANWTDFGGADIGLGGASTDQIAVTTSNIYKIVTGVKRKIRQARGYNLANRNGVFIIWRPADFELLEQFAFSTGFSAADNIIMNGTRMGMRYMDVEHYFSNQHAANHLFAGVKKVHFLGATPQSFPMVYPVDEPSDTTGQFSAKAMVTRLDYVYKTWTNMKPTLFDVNVS
jgi:hypothetical protein